MMSRKATHCVGCSLRRHGTPCARLATMRVVLRRRVSPDPETPWIATARRLPTCYQQRGARFIGTPR